MPLSIKMHTQAGTINGTGVGQYITFWGYKL